MAIAISGTAYQADRSTSIGSGRHVTVSVNGAAAAGSTTTASDGTYSISGITAASGAVLTLYLQGDAENAATVTKSTGADVAGVDLYQDHLTIRSDGGAFTTANLNTSDANGATGISAIYAATNTTATTAAGKHLLVASGQTLTPASGYTIVCFGDLLIDGTLTTQITSFIQLRSTSGSAKLKCNGSLTGVVTLNSAGGTYTLQDALHCNGLIFTAGTLDVSASNFAVTTTSLSYTAGTFAGRSGLLTLDGTSTPNNRFPPSGVYDLTIGGPAGTPALGANLAVGRNLTINPGKTLDVSASNFSVTVGGNFADNGGFTARAGTFTLNGTAQTLSGSTTFYNLVVATPGDVVTFADGTTQTISNSATFQNVTLQGSGTGGWTLAMPATQTIDHVTVSYSTATGNVAAAGAGSVDGGNNVNWTFPGAGGGGTPCLASGILGSRTVQPVVVGGRPL